MIITTARPAIENITFYSGSINEIVVGLKHKQGKNIFVDGGAEIVHEPLNEQLINERIISIIPIVAGGGTKLFNDYPQSGSDILKPSFIAVFISRCSLPL